ncbi:MAG: DUF427 domain-containing protein, partial [Woeseia sp.]
MALMIGSGPFGSSPAGRFDRIERPDRPILYWDDWPKRFRVVHDGETIADTRRARALHETGHLMRLYIPRDDVAMDKLIQSEHSTRCPWKGNASYWSVGSGEHAAENAAWAYEGPVDDANFLAGYMSFDLDSIDRWLMEEDEGYAHPRDPYHRCDIHQGSGHVTVRSAGETVAETTRPLILFETSLPPRYYIPRADVRDEMLTKSDTVTDCPYKGPAQHWHLGVRGESIEDAAW